MSELLRKDQITDAMRSLQGWTLHEATISKDFEFADFKEALAMMNAIGEKAEEMNHHPEWTNVYNRLSIHLSTHDAGGITQKDIDLAAHIDRITG